MEHPREAWVVLENPHPARRSVHHQRCVRQKEVPGRYCGSNISRRFGHLQKHPCQGAPKVAPQKDNYKTDFAHQYGGVCKICRRLHIFP